MREILALLLFLNLSACSDAESPGKKTSLTEVKWDLISYGYQEGNKSNPLNGTTYTLNFSSSQSTVEGTFDCNTFSTTYILNNLDLTLGSIFPSERNCQNSVAEDYQHQSSFILSALRSINSYEIEGHTLTVTAIDSSILVYEKIEN